MGGSRETEEVLGLVDQRLRVVRASVENEWAITNSLRNMTEETAHEYENRFIVELLQNAYDAERRGSRAGRVSIHMRHGPDLSVLYVANTGRPFRLRDVKALTNLADSTKPPGEGIGNKGVGFRSVLQVCDYPDIFSTAASHPDEGGYYFGFARPADIEGPLFDEDTRPLARLLHPSMLPVPRRLEDETVRTLLLDQYVSVIRLELRDQHAVDVTLKELSDLRQGDTPLLLFLDRISCLEVSYQGIDQGDFQLSRTSSRLPTPKLSPNAHAEEVALGANRYFVVSRELSEADIRSAIRSSVEEGLLAETWLSWHSTASVSLAFEITRGPGATWLYTHLPMTMESPVAAHLNAPFYTKLARRELTGAVPLNDWLLGQAADLAAELCLSLADTDDPVERAIAVDCLTWDRAHAGRVRRALEGRAALSDVPLPVIADATPSWAPAGDAWHWPILDAGAFSPTAASRMAAILDPALGQERLRSFVEAANDVLEMGFMPEPDLVASVVEHAASSLPRDGTSLDTWNDFYEDLVKVTEEFPEVRLKDRKILLDDAFRLRQAGPWDADDRRRRPVFLPPQRGLSAGEIPPIPSAISSALAFLHPGIHLRSAGSTRTRTPVSNMLRARGLTREYETEDVVRTLVSYAERSTSDARRTSIIRYLFDLFQRTERGREAFQGCGVPVPTDDGWKKATSVTLGTGWGDRDGDALGRLLADVDAGTDLAKFRQWVIREPEAWVPPSLAVDELRQFLRVCGVRTGLLPLSKTVTRLEEPGAWWSPNRVAKQMPLSEDMRAMWVEALESSASPRHPQTPYRSQPRLWVLPGADDYGALNTAQRLLYAEVLLRSLSSWPSACFTFAFERFQQHHATAKDRQEWSSPLAAALDQVSWMPVKGPPNREVHQFVTPAEAWYFDDDTSTPPTFLTLIETRLRAIIRARTGTITRLHDFGVDTWNAPDSALFRLQALAVLVESGAIRPAEVDAFKKAARTAVHDALIGQPDFISASVDITAAKGSELRLLRAGDPRVYLVDEPDTYVARLLETLDAPLLLVDPRDANAFEERGPRALRAQYHRTSRVAVEVFADNSEVRPDTAGIPLFDIAPWLDEWFLLAAHFSSQQFWTPTEQALETLAQKLLAVRLVQGDGVDLRVDDVSVDPPAQLADSIPLSFESMDVLVVERRPEPFGWGALDRACDGIAELLRATAVRQDLHLLAVRLRDLLGGSWRRPTDDEYASALRRSQTSVAEIRARRRGGIDRLTELMLPVVAAMHGIPSAQAILDSQPGNRDELLDLLTGVLGSAVTATDLIEKAEVASGATALAERLHVSRGALNRALRQLGRPPVHDREEHERMAEVVLASQRLPLLDALRATFLQDFDARQSLQRFVDLREGPPLTPRIEDLDEYASPPESLIVGRLDAWLKSHGCRALGSGVEDLHDYDDTRRENIALIRRQMPHTLRVARAWSEQHQRAMPVESTEAALLQLDEGGWLDFRILSEEDLPALLAAAGAWPPAMPTTDDPTALGLDAARFLESEAEDDSDAAARQRKRQARETITVAGRDVDANDLARVAVLVAATVGPSDLAQGRRLAGLTPRSTGGRRSQGDRPGPSSGRGSRASQAVLDSIGLAGEVVAYHWLRHRFHEFTDACWVSANREFLLGGRGDDTRGFDFLVPLRSVTYRYEVKATTGEDGEFEMSQGEILEAQDHTTKRQYRVIFIRNVLDPARRKISVLPNPMSPEGRQQYGQVGRGIRFSFRLDSTHAE